MSKTTTITILLILSLIVCSTVGALALTKETNDKAVTDDAYELLGADPDHANGRIGFVEGGIYYEPTRGTQDEVKVVPRPGGYSGDVVIPSTVVHGKEYRVTSIQMELLPGSGAFEGCTSLTSVTIPDSVSFISQETFKGCTSLTSVTIPDSVTRIYKQTFMGCTSLTSVTMGGVVTIDMEAFMGCTSLTSVTMGNVRTINIEAFKDCTSLTSITIPASAKVIDNYAFYGCKSLTAVYVEPSIVPYLGCEVFHGCADTLKIYVPEESVYNYKGDYNWKYLADKIVADDNCDSVYCPVNWEWTDSLDVDSCSAELADSRIVYGLDVATVDGSYSVGPTQTTA